MKYSQAEAGRVFVVRLENGDIVHESIEGLAKAEGISAASVVILGGADAGSKMVVGPRERSTMPPDPMTTVLDNAHEVCGTGTIFPDESGAPVLHLHLACGRNTTTVTGCVRLGVRVWHVMEAVVYELTSCQAVRRKDKTTGFALLEP